MKTKVLNKKKSQVNKSNAMLYMVIRQPTVKKKRQKRENKLNKNKKYKNTLRDLDDSGRVPFRTPNPRRQT